MYVCLYVCQRSRKKTLDRNDLKLGTVVLLNSPPKPIDFVPNLTTLVVDVRSSEQVAVIQKTLLSTSVFHKDQSLARRHFSNTPKTSHISWKACSITCSLMTCRAKSTEGQLMSQQSPQLKKTVLWTSAPGAQRNVFSSMPKTAKRPKFCGSARQQTCARFRQTTAASAWVPRWSIQ